ncbi:MAG: hypothetical protein ACKO81_09975 [Planctomycetota bacterium]
MAQSQQAGWGRISRKLDLLMTELPEPTTAKRVTLGPQWMD